MWKYIFKSNKRNNIEEELAPETRPVISEEARLFIIKKGSNTPPEKVSYKLIKKRRRERIHTFY